MRRAKIAVVTALLFAAGLVNPALAQTPMRTVPPGCGWIEHDRGWRHALVCNGGILRGFQDFEGGYYVPGKPKRLNVNISGGSALHRGYVVLSADNGKGTIMEGGHLDKLLLVRSPRYGGSEARTNFKFKRGLVVCDNHGRDCLNVHRTLSRLAR